MAVGFRNEGGGEGGRVVREWCVQDVGNKFSPGTPDRQARSLGGQFFARGSKETLLENLLSKMEAAATEFQEARNDSRAPWGWKSKGRMCLEITPWLFRSQSPYWAGCGRFFFFSFNEMMENSFRGRGAPREVLFSSSLWDFQHQDIPVSVLELWLQWLMCEISNRTTLT